MLQYTEMKPRVYVETTVVNYLIARHRLEMLTGLNVLDMPTEAVMLVQNLIVEVCRNAGFKPTTLCTPTELIEEIHVKEKPDTRTDPVLEECY